MTERSASGVPPVSATVAVLVVATCFVAGCSHPAAWISEPDTFVEAGVFGPHAIGTYDVDRDHRTDYVQIYNDQGMKRRLLFDTTGDGQFDETVDLDEQGDGTRTLIFLLDGISYDLMADLYAKGHFRLFYPPGRIVPGYPTVTDNIYADFFETPRPFGVEALYVDRVTRRMTGGNNFYLAGGNERVWPKHMIWRQAYIYDGIVYALPDWVAGRELDKSVGAVINWYDNTDDPYGAIYMVSTDALGHKMGHEYLKQFLLRVDTAFEKLMWHSRGKLRIVCLADHALNEMTMKRSPILKALKNAGFTVRDRIEDDRDVAVPDFGLISCAAVYARRPAEVADAMAGVEGVALAIYPSQKSFVVVAHDGKATVEADSQGRYRYVADHGDPLRLLPIIAAMREQGTTDADGWASAKAWLDATWDHQYPDPLVRIAHAFEGNVIHPPDVLLDFEPNYYYGEDDFDAFATLRGTHGALHRSATTTYVLSTFFEPPVYQRGTELRDDLKRRLGRDTLLPERRRK
jgi:hypothetical protein